jgi:hypothetical protein
MLKVTLQLFIRSANANTSASDPSAAVNEDGMFSGSISINYIKNSLSDNSHVAVDNSLTTGTSHWFIPLIYNPSR